MSTKNQTKNQFFGKYSFLFLIALLVVFQTQSIGQEKKSFSNNEVTKDNVYMTWNKNTPEQEMKDDCKALKEYGVTIAYSDVKRNAKGEITRIKVTYSDRKGNSGTLELNHQKPINTIKFYKQNDEVGFGEPSNANVFAGNDFFDNFSGGSHAMKPFDFQFSTDSLATDKFHFSFPEGKGFGQSKSKIIIKENGKKPLVIEDDKVIEGGEDYTPEEIEKIKKENHLDHFGFNNERFKLGEREFDLRSQEGLDNFRKKMEEMQAEIKKGDFFEKKESEELKSDLDKTRDEMLKAKEEMLKAKTEMEKAKKELEKTKSNLKTQKA